MKAFILTVTVMCVVLAPMALEARTLARGAPTGRVVRVVPGHAYTCAPNAYKSVDCK
jgi:hypothetical protein